MSSSSYISRSIGLLFVLPLFAYGFGNHLFTSFTWKTAPLVFGAGCVFIFLNSVLVTVIAGRMYFLLHTRSRRIAWIYLISRFGEAVLLLYGLVTTSAQATFMCYQSAMLLLGFGSLPLFFLLFQQRLFPRFLSGWALLGYSLLAVGAIAELFGLPWGIALALPGGLFELSFGLWLLFRKAPAVNQL